jgi:hypothetical protein
MPVDWILLLAALSPLIGGGIAAICALPPTTVDGTRSTALTINRDHIEA